MPNQPTKEGLLALFQRKQILTLAEEFKSGITTFEEFENKTEAQWKEFYGFAGIDIYNYLHPPPQGISGKHISKNSMCIVLLNDAFSYNSIDLSRPHLERNVLLNKIYSNICTQKFVMFRAPPSSGKTSLLKLFAAKYSTQFQFKYIDCKERKDLRQVFNEFGLPLDYNLNGSSYDPKYSKGNYIFLMDDAQMKFTDTNFWMIFLKNGMDTNVVPNTVRFIISATYNLDPNLETPEVMKQSAIYISTDFLVNQQECDFMVTCDLGLNKWIPQPLLVSEQIYELSRGLLGAIVASIDYLNLMTNDTSDPSIEYVFDCLFSKNIIHGLDRCYGRPHHIPIDENYRQFLSNCFFIKGQPAPMNLNDKDKESFERLQKVGILIKEKGMFQFSSPFAFRFFFDSFFPQRCSSYDVPKSLRNLVIKAISDMSASLIQNAIPCGENFPKEATFQHLLMNSLAKFTSPDISICPELSRIYPGSGVVKKDRINGEIDFFLNGNLRWGIELLVNGNRIGEHMNRFDPLGRYFPLQLNDYLVVDFRGNEDGNPTNVTRIPNRLTVFFKIGDFSTCRIVFGDASVSEMILNLKV